MYNAAIREPLAYSLESFGVQFLRNFRKFELMFQLHAATAVIILVFGSVAFSYTSSIARNIHSQTKLFAGGFGKSPSVKKDNNPRTPKVTGPVKEEIIRYVTKKGNGSCVTDNHCESFNTVYPKIRAVHSDPPIFEIDNFFSKELCESYIARSAEGTEILCQPLAGSATTKRTSQTKYLKYENAQEMIDAAETLTGILSNRYEEPQVVHYLPGNTISLRILFLLLELPSYLLFHELIERRQNH